LTDRRPRHAQHIAQCLNVSTSGLVKMLKNLAIACIKGGRHREAQEPKKAAENVLSTEMLSSIYILAINYAKNAQK
jgi:hypothetical protein